MHFIVMKKLQHFFDIYIEKSKKIDGKQKVQKLFDCIWKVSSWFNFFKAQIGKLKNKLKNLNNRLYSCRINTSICKILSRIMFIVWQFTHFPFLRHSTFLFPKPRFRTHDLCFFWYSYKSRLWYKWRIRGRTIVALFDNVLNEFCDEFPIMQNKKSQKLNILGCLKKKWSCTTIFLTLEVISNRSKCRNCTTTNSNPESTAASSPTVSHNINNGSRRAPFPE